MISFHLASDDKVIEFIGIKGEFIVGENLWTPTDR